MITASPTIAYYNGDNDEEKAKQVVRSDGWFKLLRDHDALGYASAM